MKNWREFVKKQKWLMGEKMDTSGLFDVGGTNDTIVTRTTTPIKEMINYHVLAFVLYILGEMNEEKEEN